MNIHNLFFSLSFHFRFQWLCLGALRQRRNVETLPIDSEMIPTVPLVLSTVAQCTHHLFLLKVTRFGHHLSCPETWPPQAADFHRHEYRYCVEIYDMEVLWYDNEFSLIVQMHKPSLMATSNPSQLHLVLFSDSLLEAEVVR